MITEHCDVYETYNKIVSECYPEDEAEIKIRCGKYFSEYRKKKASLINFGVTEFYTEYFMKWLPNKVCLEDKRVIEGFYPTADEFIRLSDMLRGTSEYNWFKMMDRRVKYESVRLMLLKKNIMSFNKSFIISKIPCIIDFDRYLAKKNENDQVEHDRGVFRVESLFTENSAVLDSLNGGYFIRLFFDASIMGLIKEGDLLDIKVRRKKGEKWKLEDINACYAGKGIADDKENG